MPSPFHPPETCPFCGEPKAGEGKTQVYYTCGAHVWVTLTEVRWERELHGHPGTCED